MTAAAITAYIATIDFSIIGCTHASQLQYNCSYSTAKLAQKLLHMHCIPLEFAISTTEQQDLSPEASFIVGKLRIDTSVYKSMILYVCNFNYANNQDIDSRVLPYYL